MQNAEFIELPAGCQGSHHRKFKIEVRDLKTMVFVGSKLGTVKNGLNVIMHMVT